MILRVYLYSGALFIPSGFLKQGNKIIENFPINKKDDNYSFHQYLILFLRSLQIPLLLFDFISIISIVVKAVIFK
jgi:hypothetical protein